MSDSEIPPFRVDLWGATSVGKTSALAAYVCATTTAWIDERDRVTSDAKLALLRTWNRFASNQVTSGTTRPTVYQFKHKPTGRVVEMRDMRGGSAAVLDDETDSDSLRRADAAILFIGWPQCEDETLTALNNANVLAHNERSVLVLTKAEMYLRLEELALFLYDPIGEARRHRFPDRVIRVMEERFRGRIYPVSVFGYRADGLPATYMDEFGRMRPWGVSPVNVELPFDHVIGGVA